MNIDDAIEHLKELKEEGATHVIFEAWPAGFFGLNADDARWPYVAEQVMFDGDWTTVNRSLQEMVEEVVAQEKKYDATRTDAHDTDT